MADTKISALTDLTNAAATDLIPAVRAGANGYLTPGYLRTYMLGQANAWTAKQSFSGTGHAGLQLNNLTTTQRDALTGAAGDLIWNTTTGALNVYTGSAWSAIVSGSAAGSGTELQYRNSGAFGAMSGTAWDDTNRALAITGATVTTSNPVWSVTQTWNAGAVTFTGLKANFTDTASASASLMLDLQIGGTTKANVRKDGLGSFAGGLLCTTVDGTGMVRNGPLGGLNLCAGTLDSGGGAAALLTSNIFAISGGRLNLQSGNVNTAADCSLFRSAAHTFGFGPADAAAPSAQAFQFQSVVGGTSNTAGQNTTINGSRGTGTGAGGDIIFKTAAAGSSGSTQNTLAEVFRVRNDGLIGFGTHSAIAAETVTGYITIKDSGGTSRKIAVVS